MKRKLVAIMLTIMVAVTFVPMISFGLEEQPGTDVVTGTGNETGGGETDPDNDDAGQNTNDGGTTENTGGDVNQGEGSDGGDPDPSDPGGNSGGQDILEGDEIDISSYAIALSIQSTVYTGKAIEPQVTVTSEEGVLLEETYYDVEYLNNTDIGTATVTVTGKEGYTGTLTATFIINPGKANVKSVTPFYKGATAYIKGVSGGVSYQLRYKVSGGSWKYFYLGTATSKTIKKLTNRKYYWFNTRAYKKVDGKTYYGAWGKAVKQQVGIPISKCKITGITNKVYTGKIKTQNVKVTYKGKKATFKIKYGNRKIIGKRYLKVIGTGNYIGSVTKYYKIVPGQVKITGMCPYEWFADSDDPYSNYISEPQHEYFCDYSAYSDEYGYYIKNLDLSCSAVKGGVSYQFAFKHGNSAWEYCSYGKDRSICWFDFPRNQTLYAKARAYKVVDGVKYYGKWSPTVTETSKWKRVYIGNNYHNTKYVKGTVYNVYKGEYLRIKAGKTVVTKKITKNAYKYTFKVKVGKKKAGTKIKVSLLTRFKENIYYATDQFYYAKYKKGMTKAQARNCIDYYTPDEKSYSDSGEYWWYDDGSYLYFRGGKLRSWYIY